MKIKVKLNRQSINHAKQYLLYIKKVFPTIMNNFMEDVALWLIDRANMHLDNSDIGENVKMEIRNGWTYNFTPSGITISNSTSKAVVVEFGVGIVGESNSHPQADTEGYEYNIDTPYKQDDGSWHFFANEADLDLPKSAIDWGVNGKGTNNRMSIYTRGSKGVWYAYNAIADANMELSKPDGGQIGALWRKAKKGYF